MASEIKNFLSKNRMLRESTKVPRMLTQLAATVATAESPRSLYFHTVPKEAVAASEVPLEEVVGSLCSSPLQALSLGEWQELTSSLDDLDRERALSQMPVFFPTISEGMRRFESAWEVAKELAEAPLRRLCELMLVRPVAPASTDSGLLTVSPSAFVLSNQVRDSAQASSAMVETWARATSLMTTSVPDETELHDSLLQIELPHHNSPEVSGTSVDGFLGQLRHAVYLPLTGGAIEVASQLSHEEFVLALETTAVSGAITLVFAATVNLTDRLISSRKSRDE
jgi:hypothetical protein